MTVRNGLHRVEYNIKTCSVKPSLIEWESETENWKTEISMGFKWSLTGIFSVLRLKSTNIILSTFYEETKNKTAFNKTAWNTLVWMESENLDLNEKVI